MAVASPIATEDSIEAKIGDQMIERLFKSIFFLRHPLAYEHDLENESIRDGVQHGSLIPTYRI